MFFFQAEDVIRDIGVTGVQTCALPISAAAGEPAAAIPGSQEPVECRGGLVAGARTGCPQPEACGEVVGAVDGGSRSEERCVGKGCSSRWSLYLSKIKITN